MNSLCDYGCNQTATFKFKNGKNCCSQNTNYCSAVRDKNVAANKGRTPTNACLEAAHKSRKGVASWNAGLTKETDVRVAELSAKVSIAKNGKAGSPHSQKTKDALSIIAKERKLGGYVRGSGRGKKGWYKGYFCDSSWELAWVIYNLDHEISFVRNTEKFEYEFEGKKKFWLPDFILSNGDYVEIKGYMTSQVDAKILNFPKKLRLLKKEEMKLFIDYVVDKYSKDYILLYE